MPNPEIPQLLGVHLGGEGVANTQVIATNLTTGDTLTVVADEFKNVLLNANDFTSGFTNGDVIQFDNVGASKGTVTITTNTSSGFQEASLVGTAASTASIDI